MASINLRNSNIKSFHKNYDSNYPLAATILHAAVFISEKKT